MDENTASMRTVWVGHNNSRERLRRATGRLHRRHGGRVLQMQSFAAVVRHMGSAMGAAVAARD